MKKTKIQGIRYSPGYSDMLGGYHGVSLEKDSDGKWTYVCRDREHHSAPTVVSTYAVTDGDAARLEEFIIKKRVISLEKRPEGDVFLTDYSPWSWTIDFETERRGKAERRYCSFGQYGTYSRRDRKLLNGLEERFNALRGEKLSEKEEQNVDFPFCVGTGK